MIYGDIGSGEERCSHTIKKHEDDLNHPLFPETHQLLLTLFLDPLVEKLFHCVDLDESNQIQELASDRKSFITTLQSFFSGRYVATTNDECE